MEAPATVVEKCQRLIRFKTFSDGVNIAFEDTRRGPQNEHPVLQKEHGKREFGLPEIRNCQCGAPFSKYGSEARRERAAIDP